MSARHSTSIYRPAIRPRSRADNGRVSTEPDVGVCAPLYRGFRLHCVGAQIPALQRAVDEYWTHQYGDAATPADKVSVLMRERAQRFEPRDWPPVSDASSASATGPGPVASPEDWK